MFGLQHTQQWIIKRKNKRSNEGPQSDNLLLSTKFKLWKLFKNRKLFTNKLKISGKWSPCIGLQKYIKVKEKSEYQRKLWKLKTNFPGNLLPAYSVLDGNELCLKKKLVHIFFKFKNVCILCISEALCPIVREALCAYSDHLKLICSYS